MTFSPARGGSASSSAVYDPSGRAAARAAIVRVLVRGKPVAGVDEAQIAKKTDGFSGADLKGMLDLAVERKLAEAMQRGTPTPITTRDLLEAAKDVRPSTREWFATARNYVLFSNQGGFYDAVAGYLKL